MSGFAYDTFVHRNAISPRDCVAAVSRVLVSSSWPPHRHLSSALGVIEVNLIVLSRVRVWAPAASGCWLAQHFHSVSAAEKK